MCSVSMPSANPQAGNENHKSAARNVFAGLLVSASEAIDLEAVPATTRSRFAAGAGQAPRGYLRAAQAYILISMPTGTSTIFGVFQVIWLSQLTVQNNRTARNVKPLHAWRKS